MNLVIEFNETAMARMTEQEAWELEDRVTRAEITLGPNGSDWLSRREARLMGMNNVSPRADKSP